jgi:hypothetical protein
VQAELDKLTEPGFPVVETHCGGKSYAIFNSFAFSVRALIQIPVKAKKVRDMYMIKKIHVLNGICIEG